MPPPLCISAVDALPVEVPCLGSWPSPPIYVTSYHLKKKRWTRSCAPSYSAAPMSPSEFILRAAHPPLLVSVGCAPFGQGGFSSRVLFWPNRQIVGSPNLSVKAWKCKVRSNAALKIGPRPWALFVLRVRRDFDAVVHGSFQIARFVVHIWTLGIRGGNGSIHSRTPSPPFTRAAP